MNQFARLRQRMVDTQLRSRGIRDQRVLAAMLAVPREEFVSEALRHEAYDDWPQPIGAGQTISQPFTVAYMAQAAELRGDERILEVGTGSGYGAAVLSRLGGEVHTIERIAALAQRAAATLDRLHYANVHVHLGDGSLGLPQDAPFDVIVVTAGAAHLPPSYPEQLADGGRIVIPIGKSTSSQHLYRFRSQHGKLSIDDLGEFLFVPLIGDEGWHLM
ncbi:MAG TPA: protein-L-isoaspartate(D-aspartate) O-methyltransferase [Pirellulaceae bacterium]|nr:protein-L-isoaspartate(D-aspartate) O-methyltransferase [Pirellulaceae bacterium]